MPAAVRDDASGRDSEHIRRYVLKPKQRAFVDSPAPFTFYVGGIGAGKSYAGAVRAIRHALTHDGSLGLIGAPTYTMLRDTTERTFFALLPRAAIASFNRNEQHLRLVNGAEILFRSLDAPDRVRGLNLSWFWLDEAPLCGYYAWQILKGRLRQSGVAPCAWATGTPHGKDGYYRDFEARPQPGHALYRASTHENASNLPPGYVESLGYEGAFAEQEILGLFTAFEGLVYRFESDLVQPDTHVRAAPEGKRFAQVIGGVDWGYTNPAVALVFGLDGDGRAWQLAEFYQRRAGLEEDLLPAILAFTRTYGVTTWYCGPDEPEHIEKLARVLDGAMLDARARPADNRITPGIQTLTRLLAMRGDGTRGLYVDPACVNTIAEFGSYQYATKEASVRNADEKPVKQNDHAMDAARYALHTLLGRAPRGALPYATTHLRSPAAPLPVPPPAEPQPAAPPVPPGGLRADGGYHVFDPGAEGLPTTGGGSPPPTAITAETPLQEILRQLQRGLLR